MGKARTRKIDVNLKVSGTCTSETPKDKKGWVDLGPTYVSDEGVVEHFWVREYPKGKQKRLKGTVEVPND